MSSLSTSLMIQVDASLVAAFERCDVSLAHLRAAIAQHGARNLAALVDHTCPTPTSATASLAERWQMRDAFVDRLSRAATALRDEALAQRFRDARLELASDSSGGAVFAPLPKISVVNDSNSVASGGGRVAVEATASTGSDWSSLPPLPSVGGHNDDDARYYYDDEIDYDEYVHMPTATSHSLAESIPPPAPDMVGADHDDDVPPPAPDEDTFAELPRLSLLLDVYEKRAPSADDSLSNAHLVEDVPDDTSDVDASSSTRFKPLGVAQIEEFDDDDDDDDLEFEGEPRLPTDSAREYDVVDAPAPHRSRKLTGDLAHSKPLPPVPGKRKSSKSKKAAAAVSTEAPPARPIAYEELPADVRVVLAKTVGEFASQSKATAARSLVAFATQRQFERLCTIIDATAGVAGAANERVDAGLRGVAVSEWPRFGVTRLLLSVLRWLAAETALDKTVVDAVLSRVHRACDASPALRTEMQAASQLLEQREVETIFKHLDVRDCAWFLGGVERDASKLLPAACPQLWASVCHAAADVQLLGYDLPKARDIVRPPDGCPPEYAEALMIATDTILRLSDARQTEIVWLGKAMRDEVTCMYADLPLTNLSAAQEDIGDDGESGAASVVVSDIKTGTIRCLKSVGVIPAPPNAVLPFVMHLEGHKKWDPLFLDGRIVEQFSEFVGVRHCTYRAKRCSLVRARSFVFVIHFVPLAGGGWLCAARSVRHPRVGVDKSTVRGVIEASGWLLLPDGNQNTVVVHITLAAFGGSVPKKVYELIQARLPMGVMHLRKLCMENAAK
jgi:hypothetical protein